MTARVRTLCWTVMLVLWATYAVADMAGPSTTTDVFSRMAWLQMGAQNAWRGFARGELGMYGGGAVCWGGAKKGSTNVILSGEASTAALDRSDASDLLRGGVALVYRIDDKGSLVWVGGDVFVLPGAETRVATGEVAAGLKALVPVWLPERRPTFFVEARRDLSRYEASYLRGAIRLDYKFAVKWSAMLDVGHAWSGLPAGDAVGSRSFGSQGTDLTLTLLRQMDPAELDSWPSSFEPFVRMLWNRGNSDPNLIDAGIRVVFMK